MPIIKSSTYLTNYSFSLLDEKVVKMFFDSSISIYDITITLKLFECFCDVTYQPIKYITMSSRAFDIAICGFIGSLHNHDLIGGVEITRQRYANIFLETIRQMRNHIPELLYLESSTSMRNKYYPVWESLQKNPVAIRYWSGFPVISRKGRKAYLRLASLWRSHGSILTEQLYAPWLAHTAKQANPNFVLFNAMATFLSGNFNEFPPSIFNNSIKLLEFFNAFAKHYFLDSHKRGLDLNSQIHHWNMYLSEINEVFVRPGLWVRPAGRGLPSLEAEYVPGAKRNIYKTANGVVVKRKLITEVPIEVTDDEAIEILFRDIKKDINLVLDWALTQVVCLYNRYQRRKALAKNGTPINSGAINKNVDELRIENIAATFEQDGFQIGEHYLNKTYGRKNRIHVAKLLGLPTLYSLFPYQLLLVAEHPEITSKFIEKFELYNMRGNKSGFLKTDYGYKLIGFKDRRGKKDSEQKIDLTNRSTELIKEIIEITNPLRDYLKKNGDDNWRYLFLNCGEGFAKPSIAALPIWSKNQFSISKKMGIELHEQFRELTGFSGDALTDFICRISLSALRASCGVQIYLDTGSIHEMSKALGHKNYTADLLSHYLPDPILAFFQARWVRIFQRAFLCEALKNSPFILQATKFNSIDELDIFLKNHAIHNIPSHLENPENINKNDSEAESHVVISVNVGVLTALISLEKAVDCAVSPDNVVGKARFWHKFSQSVAEEISNGYDKNLISYLKEARTHADASKMEKLIYGSAPP